MKRRSINYNINYKNGILIGKCLQMYQNLIKKFLFTILFININQDFCKFTNAPLSVNCHRVVVKMYDHRAFHDPKEMYGTGPWHYLGHGYGIEYQYEPDFSYQRQKGYGYIHAYGRDFCTPGKPCQKRDPQFFDRLYKFNGGETFLGQPVQYLPREVNSLYDPSPYPKW